MVRGSYSTKDTWRRKESEAMSSRNPEKERWAFYFHCDMDNLADLVRDYMRNSATGYKEDDSQTQIEGMTENYDGEISETVQALTQAVLCDLEELWRNEDSGEQRDTLGDAYEVITKTLGKEFPCLGIDSWNSEICEQRNCRIKAVCYTTNSFNDLNPKQKRQWVLDQMKKGIGCN